MVKPRESVYQETLLERSFTVSEACSPTACNGSCVVMGALYQEAPNRSLARSHHSPNSPLRRASSNRSSRYSHKAGQPALIGGPTRRTTRSWLIPLSRHLCPVVASLSNTG